MEKVREHTALLPSSYVLHLHLHHTLIHASASAGEPLPSSGLQRTTNQSGWIAITPLFFFFFPPSVRANWAVARPHGRVPAWACSRDIGVHWLLLTFLFAISSLFLCTFRLVEAEGLISNMSFILMLLTRSYKLHFYYWKLAVTTLQMVPEFTTEPL